MRDIDEDDNCDVQLKRMTVFRSLVLPSPVVLFLNKFTSIFYFIVVGGATDDMQWMKKMYECHSPEKIDESIKY